MSKVIETLMHEHRFIEGGLAALASFTSQLEPGQPDDRQRLGEFAEFFREFADRCHHGKEEAQLFAALADHGFPRTAGPLYVMVAEHDMGRTCVRELSAIAAGEGPLSPKEVDRVGESADALIQLLRSHIQKEDQILFPAAERALPPDVLDRLAIGFEQFEHDVMGEGKHNELHELGARLLAAYPAGDPTQRQPARCGYCPNEF